METLQFILQLLISLGVGYMFFWTKGYSKKTGEYKADFENLPNLTKDVESIKSELHRFTELQLGFKSEERRAIFEMADAISNAINHCLHPSTFIVDDSDDKQIQQAQNEVWQSLRQLTTAQTHFEILCESEPLKQAVSDLVSSIHHQLVPQVHPYLFGIIGLNIKLRGNERQHNLLFEGPPRPIEQIESESEKLMTEQDQLRKERVELARTNAENVMKPYREVVGPLRRKFIQVAHAYLKELMSNDPDRASENSTNNFTFTEAKRPDTKGLPGATKDLLDEKPPEKIVVPKDREDMVS